MQPLKHASSFSSIYLEYVWEIAEIRRAELHIPGSSHNVGARRSPKTVVLLCFLLKTTKKGVPQKRNKYTHTNVCLAICFLLVQATSSSNRHGPHRARSSGAKTRPHLRRFGTRAQCNRFEASRQSLLNSRWIREQTRVCYARPVFSVAFGHC